MSRKRKTLNSVSRGSSNQRIIDVKESLRKGETVLAKEFYEKEKK